MTRATSRTQRLLREPLLHFFLLGAVLFGSYAWLQGARPTSPNEIVVSHGQVQSLQMQFERVWQRPATKDELQTLIDGWVKEEILYREGIAMALDRDDPVVRRRVAQKVEFIFDSAAPPSPSEAELQAWLDAHPNEYHAEATYSFQQVFFNPARHGSKIDADIVAARRALEGGKSVESDPTLLPTTMKAAGENEVAQTFGREFAEKLQTLSIGGWQGPLRSAFGQHLVQLNIRNSGGRAALHDVRAAVTRDLLHAHAEDAKAAAYQRLRAGYKVRIDSGNDATSSGG